MKRISKLLLLALVLALAFSGFVGTAKAQEKKITIFLGSVGDLVPDQEIVDRWGKEKGVKVEFVYAPQSATDILAVIQQFLAAKSADVDLNPVRHDLARHPRPQHARSRSVSRECQG